MMVGSPPFYHPSSHMSTPRRPRIQPTSLGAFVIPERELHFTFARSGGPGGQNVNKVETKVTVTFDFFASRALSWEQKGKLGRHPLVTNNVNADGALVVTCQTYRTQAQNREEAVRRLHELIVKALRPKKKRIPTKKTRASDRERLSTKKARANSKAARRRVDPYGDG